MTHHRETVTTAGVPAASPYSHAVKSSGLIFLSGQVHLDPEAGELVEGSVGDITRRCLDNLAIVAREAGAELADAVRIAVYVTDVAMFKELNEAYGAYFESDPPARTTIGVAALPMGARMEMDAILALPDEHRR
jgi:2-iminobutanoate/2-iminopropanoate deaminase